MAYRDNNKYPPLLDTVIYEQLTADIAKKKVTEQSIRKDAIKILESLIAEHGIGTSMNAIKNQGFDEEAFLYLVKPLYREATKRREAQERGQSANESETSIEPESLE
ncbi:hypothetical protein [Vibrio sp. HN007]|uniref:hypothetical protein n=1 Tax=Vibrio iocasae TaxID=3098914 RepID=UPI0035D4BBE6